MTAGRRSPGSKIPIKLSGSAPLSEIIVRWSRPDSIGCGCAPRTGAPTAFLWITDGFDVGDFRVVPLKLVIAVVAFSLLITFVRWFKQEGDPVQKGEPLFELDTDKVTVEVEAFADGVLQRILVPEGSGVIRCPFPIATRHTTTKQTRCPLFRPLN